MRKTETQEARMWGETRGGTRQEMRMAAVILGLGERVPSDSQWRRLHLVCQFSRPLTSRIRIGIHPAALAIGGANCLLGRRTCDHFVSSLSHRVPSSRPFERKT